MEDPGVSAFPQSRVPATAPDLALPVNPPATPSEEGISENLSSVAPCSLSEGEERGLEVPPGGSTAEPFLCVHFKGAADRQAGISVAGQPPGHRARRAHCGTTWPCGHRCSPALGRVLWRCPNATSWGVIGAATSADRVARYKAPAGPAAETRSSPPWPRRRPSACFWSCCSWLQRCRHHTSEGSSSTW